MPERLPSTSTVHHATIEEAVFSVDPTNAPIDWLYSDHVICVSCDACPFRGYISMWQNSFEAVTSYEWVVAAEARKQDVAVSWRSTEEYKKSACEDLTYDLKTLCVL
jgi:hypothetical protein